MNIPTSRRPLGLMMSMSLVIGTMIGSGIYFLPSSLAPLGWNTALGWFISGAGALCLAMTFRFLMDGTGEGIQHNVERIIGEVPGFLAIFAYWASGFTSIAALNIAGGSIIATMVFPEGGDRPGIIVAVALVWLLTAINLSGTRSAGRLQVLSVIIKVISLLLVIGACLWVMVGPEPLQEMAPAPVSFDNISGAVALTLFALLGFEAASIPVNKISDPGRNIPLALIGGTLLVVSLYLLVSTGLVLVIPWQDIASSSSPVSDALTQLLGPIAGTLVALCIMVSVIGCANGLLLIGADCTYSMALRREVPQFFARTNTRGVPHWGVVAQAIGVSVLILANTSRGLSGMFTFMALLTTGGVLVFYLLGVVAAIRENRKVGRWPVLLLGLAFAAFATYGSGLETSLWVLVLLGIAMVVRWACKRNVPTPGTVPA
ncbi:APC family permease [Aurantiacibacter zhengii]|uniref:Arginine/agmatine antiporter n=1 Tax=Aurantiacibacter zhengii TaxID=2307003 RepID=A0A418NQC3_9SPHN|nr:APC family permease [Aurantiacibacter zhengii]RIV84645.1 APC family permease [Aurantiacibacter zhengii]